MYESIEQNKRRAEDWDSINWDTTKRHVRRLQERIFRATRDKDFAKDKNQKVRKYTVFLVGTNYCIGVRLSLRSNFNSIFGILVGKVNSTVDFTIFASLKHFLLDIHREKDWKLLPKISITSLVILDDIPLNLIFPSFSIYWMQTRGKNMVFLIGKTL